MDLSVMEIVKKNLQGKYERSGNMRASKFVFTI